MDYRRLAAISALAGLLSAPAFAGGGYGAQNTYSLAVTALQDSHQNTDVSLSVSGPAADQAKQIQLKSFDVNNQLQWTKNFHDVTLEQGAVTMQFNDMVRFQPVQAQLQMQTAASQNAEVLRAKATVFLRPDLAIKSIDLPKVIYKGQVANITANIQELNGDLGADTVVYLREGDQVLDVAQGVHVNKGGSVQVSFSTVFTAAGTHTLTVSAEQVTPGDYDTANNAKSFDVTVLDGVQTVPYSLYYNRTDYNYSYQWSDWYGNGTYSDQEKYENLSETLQLPQPLTYPVDKISVDVTADGQKVLSVAQTDIGAPYTYSYYCYSYQNLQVPVAAGAYLYLSGVTDTCLGQSSQYVSFSQFASSQLYFSQGHSNYWGDYSYNYPYSYGVPIVANSNIGVRFVVEDDGATMGGSASATLQSTSYNYPWNYSWYGGWSKGSSSESYTGGWSSGMTTP